MNKLYPSVFATPAHRIEYGTGDKRGNGPSHAARHAPTADQRLRLVGRLLALALAALAASTAPAGAAPQRPPVLFIVVDDLNDWVGVLGGHPQAATPHIDRLAQRGVVFTNAHCCAPLCNPSRTATMTSVQPFRSGVYDNAQPWRVALPDVVALPEYFRQHGYWTFRSGKIYDGSYFDSRSWDAAFPDKHLSQPAPFVPRQRPLNGFSSEKRFDWGPVDAEEADMPDAPIVDRAIDALETPSGRPAFIACGLVSPHLPWYVPERYFAPFPLEEIQLPQVLENDLDDVPDVARRWVRARADHQTIMRHQQWRHAVRAYLAAISFADAQIGRLIDALDRSPHGADTIVVLWSDNGWHLGEKQQWRKHTLWEESTRVPLIIVAPGVARSGGVCDAPVSLIDLFPTLVDLCRLPAQKTWDGRTLRPLLSQPDADWDGVALATYGRSNQAVRTRRFRYIRYHNGSEELYDHRSDPMEWHNLALQPETSTIRARLRKRIPQTQASDAPRIDRTRMRGGTAERWIRTGILAVVALLALAVLLGKNYLTRHRPMRSPKRS